MTEELPQDDNGRSRHCNVAVMFLTGDYVETNFYVHPHSQHLGTSLAVQCTVGGTT